MRRYLLGTGLISAVTNGLALLKGSESRDFTWRVALAWLSWGITFAMSIGMILDIRRAERGGTVPADSPIAGQEAKYSRVAAPASTKKKKRR
ncbi:hypothetical protein [Microbacterium amylolyticum]|uniref:NADH:ubiquinone oxidoreductase n=1 Tax=Microbacterium amylolyticum TaxID=936337 RepID=A0ABS4ZHC4_9MICO|nr:hypothetical protein [Microbacterium amylolyticum]MBP2435886.1 hypothetical protein [Microbacterium amylolyticum]